MVKWSDQDLQSLANMSIRIAGLLVLPARVAAADPVYVDHRDAGTALAWSVAGTAASVGMTAYGISANQPAIATIGAISSLVTPSFGHWYAGHYFTAGLGIRIASTA